MDFCEVTTHYAVLELFRDRLGPHEYEVAARRCTSEGTGSIRVGYRGEWSMVPYHLPEDLERLERVAQDIAKTSGDWKQRAAQEA